MEIPTSKQSYDLNTVSASETPVWNQTFDVDWDENGEILFILSKVVPGRGKSKIGTAMFNCATTSGNNHGSRWLSVHSHDLRYGDGEIQIGWRYLELPNGEAIEDARHEIVVFIPSLLDGVKVVKPYKAVISDSGAISFAEQPEFLQDTKGFPDSAIPISVVGENSAPQSLQNTKIPESYPNPALS